MKKSTLPPTLIRAGFFDDEMVLMHLPKRYEDFHETPLVSSFKEKERIVMKGEFLKGSFRAIRYLKRSLVSFQFVRKDGHIFRIEAWNRDYLLSMKDNTSTFLLLGSYEAKRHTISLQNLIKFVDNDSLSLRPIYRLPSFVSQATFRQSVEKAFQREEGKIEDIIPEKFREKYRLEHRYEALHLAHFPKSQKEVTQALRTLKYEEALTFELSNELIKGENRTLKKEHQREMDPFRVKDFIDQLPYSLLEDQRKAFREIYKDMEGSGVMYRLLQGDVGTGKTLVAALACFANSTRSSQGALMAPTEALARQHYRTFTSLFDNSNVHVALLTGSTSPEERREILTDLADGDIDILIGTHALFAKSVHYLNLGLVIIDEQHKFGVNQRSKLLGKGEKADLLLMSATPIPRTLGLALYGDMDVSTLREFPHGKRKVETKICTPDDPEIFTAIFTALEQERRIYVVLPQIEGDSALTSVKKLYEQYNKLFPGRCVLMHGKMEAEEKREAEESFRKGERPILIATSLIEVGLDVPEAGLMIIYSASSFSLSSMHQLRGRVGRDGKNALCLLVEEEGSEENEKLKILEESDDGFAIAEADLSLRGPGDFIGVRQSGLPEFNYCNVVDDFKIFECAMNDAKEIIANPEYFDSFCYQKAKDDSEGRLLS